MTHIKFEPIVKIDAILHFNILPFALYICLCGVRLQYMPNTLLYKLILFWLKWHIILNRFYTIAAEMHALICILRFMWFSCSKMCFFFFTKVLVGDGETCTMRTSELIFNVIEVICYLKCSN